VADLIGVGWFKDAFTQHPEFLLFLAVAGGYREVVNYMIANKVDINCKDRWGGTPMNDALKSNHADIQALGQERLGLARAGGAAANIHSANGPSFCQNDGYARHG
jgi:hypothetical protein